MGVWMVVCLVYPVLHCFLPLEFGDLCVRVVCIMFPADCDITLFLLS